MLAPALAVIVAVLAYPLYQLVALSFQKYGLFELIAHDGKWIGLDNYTQILHDRQFWTVLLRTIAFTAVTVGLTMLFGTLIALLLAQLGGFMRLLISTGLVLAWAMPPVVSINIWNWMVDYEFGVANWTLSQLGLTYFDHHDWFVNPIEGFAVVTAIVVWGAIPFVAITVYAGLTQVPRELVEAASIDGSSAFRIFRDITVPILKPIFIILTSLSVIWNFQVFSQIWIIRNARPESDYFVMSIYSFVTSFGVSQLRARLCDRARDGARHVRGHVLLHPPDGPDRGDPVSTVPAAAPAPARRRRSRRRIARRVALNLTGVLVFVVMVFPVYWMVSTAFKPGNEVLSYSPKWVPTNPTLASFRDAIGRPFFWDNVKNSLIVVSAVVVASLLLAFLAALALAKFRFYGRRGFVVIIFAVQMVPLVALIIPLYIMLSRVHQVDKLTGVDHHLRRVRAPVLRLDAARLRRRRSPRSSRRRRWSTARRASARSSGSCSRWWHRASWRPRSSPSSRPGTSTSSPTSCSPARRSRR